MNIHKLVKTESLRRRYSDQYKDLMHNYNIEANENDEQGDK